MIPVPAGPQPPARPACHRADLPHHRLLRSVPPLGRAARYAFLSLLPGFVRALRSQVHGANSTLLDWTVFWTNVVAEALQPALFLHFALSFPEERFKNLRRRWLLPLVYAPGAGLLALWLWSIGTREATKLLLDRLDQIATGYDALFYILAALLFLRSYSRATTPLLRQQLKWVTRGTLLAVLPFTFFYAVPYLLRPESAAAADQSGRSFAGVFAAHVQPGPSSATG